MKHQFFLFFITSSICLFITIILPEKSLVANHRLTPALGDISQSPGQEIILTGFDGRLYAWHSDGTSVSEHYPIDLYSKWFCSSPSLGDFFNDSAIEIIIAGKDSLNNYWLFVYNGDGIKRWECPLGTINVTSIPVAGDLDADNQIEVLFGSDDGQLYAKDIAAGCIDASGWPKMLETGIKHYPLIKDIDGDGDDEIIVTSESGKVYCLNWNGSDYEIQWNKAITGNIAAKAAVDDIIGNDGFMEIFVGEKSGQVYGWDKDGNSLPGWADKKAGNYILSTPILGQMDSDENKEIIVYSDNRIYAWDANGTKINIDFAPMDYYLDSYPTANINNRQGVLLSYSGSKITLNGNKNGTGFREEWGLFHHWKAELPGDKTIKIPLVVGWNQISSYLAPSDSSLSLILNSITGNWVSVQTFQNGGWNQADANIDPSFWTLYSMNNQQGYYIYMSAVDTLMIKGLFEKTGIALNAGYNLVGYPSESIRTAQSSLSNLNGNWINLQHYENGTWTQAIADIDQSFWTLTHMIPGKGYWLKLNYPTTWHIGDVSSTLLASISNSLKNKKLSKQKSQKEKLTLTPTAKNIKRTIDKRNSVQSTKVVPPLPSSFYGSLYIDGKLAKPGSKVSAWINEINYPTNFEVHTSGKYGILSVNGDDPETKDTVEGGIKGDTIVFKINNNLIAEQIGIWQSGVTQRIDLTTGDVVSVKDNESPSVEIFVEGQSFINGDYISDEALIHIIIKDDSGIDNQNLQLTVDEKSLDMENDPNIKFNNDSLRYTKKTNLTFIPKLKDGTHTLKVDVFDKYRNGPSSASIYFNITSDLRIENVMNFPNPMSDETEFTFILTRSAKVTIKIYTVSGRLVRQLETYADASYNTLYWNGKDTYGSDLANGVYLYKITAKNNNSQAGRIDRLIIMK